MKFTIEVPDVVNCDLCGDRLQDVVEFDAVIFDKNKVRVKAWLVCSKCGSDVIFRGVFDGTE